MRVEAARELLAPPEDVWAFLADPFRLADWWPGIAGVQPDRRGMAPGARWAITGDDRPTLLRKPNMSGALLVIAAEPARRFAFQLTGERILADLVLEPRRSRRTLAVLTVEGPVLIGLSRSLPRRALNRLYALCQTSAEE